MMKTKTAIVGSLCVAWLSGCPEPQLHDDPAPVIADEETGSPGESSDSDSSGDTGETMSDESVGFIEQPDGGVGFDCDVLTQDCPADQKCAAWANDGSNVWNGTICRDVADNPQQIGDPCTVEGSGTSGYDDCALGAMCWDVDPETNTGTCIANCTGDAANPICSDPSTACTIANEGALALCLPLCDPLLQDCDGGQACYPVNGAFACAPDASGAMGLTGHACGAVNACDPGLVCMVAALVSGCTSESCCTEFCDVTTGDADAECGDAGAGQICELFYDEGEAPPGFADVGVCAIPQ